VAFFGLAHLSGQRIALHRRMVLGSLSAAGTDRGCNPVLAQTPSCNWFRQPSFATFDNGGRVRREFGVDNGVSDSHACDEEEQ
jgi:hypothetical protein